MKRTGAVAAAGGLAGCSGGDGGDGGDGGSDGGGATTTRDPGPETFTNEAGVEVGATFEAVKTLAKEEDTATQYMTQDREAFQVWVSSFEETYPDVGIDVVTGGSEDLTSRFSTEYSTDNVSGNLYSGGASGAITLIQDDQAMELSSEYMPSFGSTPDKYKDDNGEWITTDLLTGLMFYNTDMASADDADSWMDIATDSKFSDNNIGWDPTPLLDLMWGLREINGREFFEELRQQNPRFVDSHTDLARFCGAGEFAVAFTYGHKLARFAGELPLDFFRFPQAPTGLNIVLVSGKAPQPNSTLLFLNWLTSEAGQKVLGTTPYVPFHPDAVYEPYPEIMPPEGFEYVSANPSQVDYDAVSEMFNETVSPSN